MTDLYLDVLDEEPDEDDFQLPTNVPVTELFANSDEVREYVKVQLFGDLNTHLRCLQDMLMRCVEDEEYEWCAILRDEIELVKSKIR